MLACFDSARRTVDVFRMGFKLTHMLYKYVLSVEHTSNLPPAEFRACLTSGRLWSPQEALVRLMNSTVSVNPDEHGHADEPPRDTARKSPR